MNATKIRAGQRLRLKPDNPYGFTGVELYVTVAEIREKPGYRTPWIIDPLGRAFRPSDFARAAVA